VSKLQVPFHQKKALGAAAQKNSEHGFLQTSAVAIDFSLFWHLSLNSAPFSDQAKAVGPTWGPTGRSALLISGDAALPWKNRGTKAEGVNRRGCKHRAINLISPGSERRQN